jgi:uncharacterized protein (TIGR02246 family)
VVDVMHKHEPITEATAKDQVRQVMEEWRRRTAVKDVDGLLALTTEDVVFLTPGHEPFGKAEFAAGLREVLAKARIESTQDVKELRTFGDTAYAWSHLSVDLFPAGGGPKVHSSGYVLSVFRRSSAGVWQLARDANLTTGAGNPDRI